MGVKYKYDPNVPPPIEEEDDEKGWGRYSRNRKILRNVIWFLAITFVVAGHIIYYAFPSRKKQCTADLLVKVNLEPGETLLYQVVQAVEVRSGEFRRGTLRTVIALQVINKTILQYWFVFKFVSITADGENLDKIGDLTGGRSLYSLVKVTCPSRYEEKNASKFTEVHETFELYGNRQYDAELTRYGRAILTQLLPTVQRNLYERIDGGKLDPNSELKPEKSSMFPGIVRMHREANTLGNDEILITNKFNRSDVTNMTSDIDLDISYTDLSAIKKSNGMVTRGEIHLTERLNFGEPVFFNSKSTASMIVFFKSRVTLLDDEKSRNSYLEDEELSGVHVRDFVKLVAPKSDLHYTVKTSERETLNEPSADSNTTFACKDERGINLATASHDSRHQSCSQNLSRELPRAPRQKTFTLFKKKVIGVDIQVNTTVRIESSKKVYNPKPDKTELDLTLHLGASLTASLLRESINTTEQETKKMNGRHINVSYSIPILWVVTLDLEFNLFTPASISVDPGSLSALSLKVTPPVSASLKGSVAALIIKAWVQSAGHLMSGSLPLTVLRDTSRPSNRDACLNVTANLKILELEADILYQCRSCAWDGWIFKCGWGTRRTLYSSGRWPAFNLTRNIINNECF